MLLVQGSPESRGVASSLLERTASRFRAYPAKQELQANEQNEPAKQAKSAEREFCEWLEDPGGGERAYPAKQEQICKANLLS